MPPLDLVTIEHSPQKEVLIQPAAEVSFPLSHEEQQLIKEMKELVLKLDAVGLAAPQVGVGKQIIVYTIDEDAKTLRGAEKVVPPTVLINPSYTPLQDATLTYDWEGCFSVDETTGTVPRYDKISYTAQTPEGKTFTATAEGFVARVLQHEIDHIKGILILNRFSAESIKGHPDEMLPLRYKHFTPQQKEALRRILAKKEKTIDPTNLAAKQRIEKIRQLLDEE